VNITKEKKRKEKEK